MDEDGDQPGTQNEDGDQPGDEEENDDVDEDGDQLGDEEEDKDEATQVNQAATQVAAVQQAIAQYPAAPQVAHLSNVFSKLLQDTDEYGGLLQEVHKMAVKEGRIKNIDVVSFVHTGIRVLCTMARPMAEELMGGTIPKKHNDDPAFKRLLDTLNANKTDMPAIYGQYLAHPDGEAPSPGELETLSKGMRRYLSDDVYAGKIDSNYVKETNRYDKWTIHDSVNLRRRLLGKPKDNWVLGKQAPHRKLTLAFLDALDDRLQATPAGTRAYSQPDTIPLCEFGYAKSAEKRLKQHKAYDSSNYILSLARRIFLHEMPLLQIKLRQYVLWQIWDPSLAALGEILVTELGTGYIEDGYGFSHEAAGHANESSIKVPPSVYAEMQKKIMKGPGLQNLNDQKAKLGAKFKQFEKCKDLERQVREAKEELAREEQNLKTQLKRRTVWKAGQIHAVKNALGLDGDTFTVPN